MEARFVAGVRPLFDPSAISDRMRGHSSKPPSARNASSAKSKPRSGKQKNRPSLKDAKPAPSHDHAPDFRTRDKVASATALLAINATVATWGHFDFSNLMGYYQLLADAFLAGQIHIDIKPGQMYIHDLIPFGGQYYLQWGPFPAVLHAFSSLLGFELTDRVVCLLAAWATSLVYFEIILELRRRYFGRSSKWLAWWLWIALAIGSTTASMAWRATVYNESIVIGSLCVLTSYWMLLKYQRDSSPFWAGVCGALLGMALLSRITLGVYAVVLFGFFAVTLYLARPRLAAALTHLTAYSLPLAFAGGVQLFYNYARFGSPWDYGDFYLPGAIEDFQAFRLLYIPENIGHYLLAPFQFSSEFPWLLHKGAGAVEVIRAESMSSVFLASPFLLLAVLCFPIVRGTAENVSRELRLFVLATAGGSLLMCCVLLAFGSSSRRYMHDFVPLWMVLAWIGIAYYLRERPIPRVWVAPAWGTVVFSFLLHAHLAFTQPFDWDPPDANVMRTFVAWSPAVRRILPGKRLDREEAIARNDLGTLYLKNGRYQQALREFEKAGVLLPGDPRIQKNIVLARQWSQRR